MAPASPIGNEADLAAATVSLERPGRPGPVTDFVYLSGEIGIGGAVVFDGRPLPGRHGWAGELGHVTVDPSGPACLCGSTGCLELYAGKRALLEAAPVSRCDALPAALEERVRAGDETAGAAVERAAWALGVALSTVLNVVDVPVIVLGGHLRELADLLAPAGRGGPGRSACSPRTGWRPRCAQRSRMPRPVPSARHTVSSNVSSTTRACLALGRASL